MQDIYNYIPETNHVYRVHIVTATRYLQFVLHVMLFHMLNTFCPFTLQLYVCSAQCGSFVCFLDFVLFQLLAQVLSE